MACYATTDQSQEERGLSERLLYFSYYETLQLQGGVKFQAKDVGGGELSKLSSQLDPARLFQ